MTNEELIVTIRNEIERRKGYISVTHFAEELLSFLDTLESEKPMNQGLDAELKRFLQEECSEDNEPSISEIARHFAQWGAEHLKQ